MMNRASVGFLLLSMHVLCDASAEGTTSQEVSHVVQVAHAGISGTKATPQTLIQRLDQNGQPINYCFDAQSVFCVDGRCKAVTVRIFWDKLGFYKRYELASGVQLEKAEGKPFSAADYLKLHRILSDRYSPLKGAGLTEIKNLANSDSQVDGISAATPALYKRDAVEGAAWTSFTLWHWANGGLTPIMREMTAAKCTSDDLRSHLETGDANHKVFAVEQLISRKAYDHLSLDVVTRQIPQAGPALTKLALRYFQQARAEDYFIAMDRLFRTGSTTQRVMVLNAMLGTPHEPAAGFLDQFSHQLAGAKSYQEVDLLLRLMERRNPMSTEVTSQATRLLAHKNFLIARRAYWFLKDRSATASQKSKLEAFRLQHAELL